MKHKMREIHLRGDPICLGISIGKPFFLTFVEDALPEFSISPEDLEGEILRYRNALAKGREDIKRLQKQLEQERILEGAAILDAQLQMMKDPLMTTRVETEIRHTMKNAETIFHKIIKQFQKKFNSLSDPFFRERFKDIQDISQRVIGYLLESVRISLADIPADSIVFARELKPSDIAEANTLRVSAFVCEGGSATSHAAIVAKAKGIPFVTNVAFEKIESFKDCTVIVDARTGEIIINPLPETLARYREYQAQLNKHMAKLGGECLLESETFDGYAIRLSANIEMANELELLHQYGGSGVGLFRSENLCLSSDKLPSEEEQYEIYKRLVDKLDGLPIVIRTFDIGGDKFFSQEQLIPETNPFLGCRAIRFLLKEREIFKTQLRAILRISLIGDVSIMFPMISSLSELLEAKQLVKEAQNELEKGGLKLPKKVRIGCMIEVPSAAIISDILAKECDFLSIGTNDLVQYSLAVDRGNHAMRGFYTPTHPSVIRLIKLIVSEANHNGIPVTVCGEVAADPRFTPLLLGLGVHELSVASRFLPIVKNAIRNTSIVSASQMAEKALSLSTAQEIQELLHQEYKKNFPEDFFYNF